MDQNDLMKAQLDVLSREQNVLSKTTAMEFERISKAFQQMGNLLDLLYLETSVMVEMLAEKKIFTTEEFTKKLEDTAKKVEEQIKTAAEAEKKETENIVKL